MDVYGDRAKEECTAKHSSSSNGLVDDYLSSGVGSCWLQGIILGPICFLLGDDCSCFREAGHFQSEGGSLGQSLFLEFEISLVTVRKQKTRNTVHQDSWSFFTGTMQLPKVCKGWASATCVFPGLGPWFILIGFSRWDPPPRSTVLPGIDLDGD